MKTRHLVTTLILAVLCARTSLAQKSRAPSQSELAEITARGRMLAAYDSAASHATDAVQTTHPREGSIRRYIARETPNGWVVGFGRLNEAGDRFLIAYEATQAGDPQYFKVQSNDPPKEDTDYYFRAAKGIDLSERDFETQAGNRLYNVALLPHGSGEMYVYFYPAQTSTKMYVYGGDWRYLVSADQSSVIERRQMHKSILEFKPEGNNGRKVAAGMHSHILSDLPEDTDVFYVLSRKPVVPEMIGTKNHVYQIQADGTIKVEK